MTRTPQNGTMQSQLDLALNPDGGNDATYVEKVTVPKGITIYEGVAAPSINKWWRRKSIRWGKSDFY